MTSSIQLRAPTIDDATAVSALSAELGYDVTADTMTSRIAMLLERDDQHLVVAVVDGGIAGWIQIYVNTSLESGFRAEIIGLVVGAKFRRNGIGKMLVEDAIRWSRERSADVLVVRSNVNRKESHSFYPSIGFEMSKTQAVYRMSLRSAG